MSQHDYLTGWGSPTIRPPDANPWIPGWQNPDTDYVAGWMPNWGDVGAVVNPIGSLLGKAVEPAVEAIPDVTKPFDNMAELMKMMLVMQMIGD